MQADICTDTHRDSKFGWMQENTTGASRWLKTTENLFMSILPAWYAVFWWMQKQERHFGDFLCVISRSGYMYRSLGGDNGGCGGGGVAASWLNWLTSQRPLFKAVTLQHSLALSHSQNNLGSPFLFVMLIPITRSCSFTASLWWYK